MKKLLCLLTVIFILTGLCGCGKNNDTSPTDNTDSTDISDLSSMESSEITSSETESSEMITSTIVSEAADNSEVSEDNVESCASAPDDGRIEELEEENADLKDLLSTADNKIESLKNQIDDLEQQLDESSSQDDYSLVRTIPMRGGACLFLYEKKDEKLELNIEYADKSIQTIFSDCWMSTIERSPDGSKVLMNDFEEQGWGGETSVYDVNTRKKRNLLMPDLASYESASFMEWLDDRYFLFVVQLDHGTTARGGDVYVYDTQIDNYRLLIENEGNNYQVRSFDIYPEDFILFKAIKYDQNFVFTTDVYYTVTVNKIYELINSNKTMNLKEALNIPAE
jgi:hypothetical protein